MSTGHKIFTKDNICQSIRFKQVLQTPSGRSVGLSSKSKSAVNTYVKGIMDFINVTRDTKKENVLKDFVNGLFDVNENRKRKLADSKVKNNGHFKKKS